MNEYPADGGRFEKLIASPPLNPASNPPVVKPDHIKPYTYRSLSEAQGAMLEDIKIGKPTFSNITRRSLARRHLIDFSASNFSGSNFRYGGNWVLSDYGKWLLDESNKRRRTR